MSFVRSESAKIVVAILLCACHCRVVTAEDDNRGSPKDIVIRLVDRPNAIGSGLFRFRVTTYFIDANGTRSSESASEFTLAVDGSGWVKRQINSPAKRISRSGYSATYYETGIGSDREYRSLSLEASEGALMNNPSKEVWKYCMLAGTVVVPTVREFVSSHVGDATVSKDTVDGIPCTVFEYKIAKADFFKILTSVPQSIFRDESAHIKLTVADDYGGVLVRYELVGKAGSADVTVSSQIEKIADGVYWPRHWRRAEGAAITEIDLLEAQFVNEKLPHDAFEFSVPPGTRVADTRPGSSPQIFFLKSELDVNDTDALIDTAIRASPTADQFIKVRPRRGLGYLLGFNCVLVAIVVGILLWRRLATHG